MLILVMGVTATPKVAIAERLATRLGLPFYDADDFHPAENRAKIAANVPLNEDDLRPWLSALGEEAERWEREGGAVLSCAALRRSHRELLLGRVKRARVVFLEIDREAAHKKLEGRRSWPPGGPDVTETVEAEFAALEPPDDAIVVPALLQHGEIVERARRRLIREGALGAKKTYFARGAPDAIIGRDEAEELVGSLLSALGPLRRVLLLPPDFTRFHSGAGELTVMLYERLKATAEVVIMPATGTHLPMTESEIGAMFPGIPRDRFRHHSFRDGLKTLGEVPGSFVSDVSGGRVDYPIRCEVDAEVLRGWDRIISIGQLVPHEVIGIANHNKNLWVGTGGKDVIDRTHFLGAVCDMETLMGRAHTPVRDVLDYMSGVLGSELPLTYLLTVRQKDSAGLLRTRGLFAGDDEGCFLEGVPLVQSVNLDLLDEPLRKVVVYLDPEEFKSTWLGNKAIYRTRMALADGAELLVLAPGVRTFGEDPGIDRLIRRHGYRGTPNTLNAVARDPELASSLSAAAHLIHGSSEGRFRIRYAPGHLGRDEVVRVGYEYADLAESMRRYNPKELKDGMNRLPDGEEVFFISNPALGLWGLKSKFS